MHQNANLKCLRKNEKYPSNLGCNAMRIEVMLEDMGAGENTSKT
jgi:hypothetical protein